MVLCIRDAFYESRSLEMERKVGGNFHPRLIPVHSPLLKNSHLVSDPPLTYMLVSKIKPCMSKYKFFTAKL